MNHTANESPLKGKQTKDTLCVRIIREVERGSEKVRQNLYL